MKKSLTDLECTVLGVIWRDGPCTPYHIRIEFTNSPSSHWSGSAGAIYPLIRRLEKAKLVQSTPTKQGKRVGRTYHITQQGRRELDRWLSPPLPADTASIQFDPLRTRMFFLGSQPKRKALQFLEDAAVMLERELVRSEEFLQSRIEAKDRFGAAAGKGALQVARARLQWIHSAIVELGE